MSYVDELVAAYASFVALPWETGLAPAQRVWMAVYPPEHERRLRLHVPDFKIATKDKGGHEWAIVDITNAFEEWMARHEYRDEYFDSPELLTPGMPAFFQDLITSVRDQIASHPSPNGVVALLGAGTLFGLGDEVKVSALLNAVNDVVAGRLLVFFPGAHEGNNYRLLDAKDGWNYLAIPITSNGGSR